jgi:hypothetical protein
MGDLRKSGASFRIMCLYLSSEALLYGSCAFVPSLIDTVKVVGCGYAYAMGLFSLKTRPGGHLIHMQSLSGAAASDVLRPAFMLLLSSLLHR